MWSRRELSPTSPTIGLPVTGYSALLPFHHQTFIAGKSATVSLSILMGLSHEMDGMVVLERYA
jgi:hypothetical protein